METNNGATEPGKPVSTTNKKGITFALAVALQQILVCLIYGFFFDFNSDIDAPGFFGDALMISIMIILVVIGFGLLNAYITNASFTGMSATLLIFALTVEHYFLMKAFWEKAGTSNPISTKTWEQTEIEKISLASVGQDRFTTFIESGDNKYEFTHYSFVDAIACALSNILAFSYVVGRVHILQAYYLSIFGAFFYEINNQLIWKFAITDIGFGMRIFLFAGVYGLMVSLLLGKKQTTFNHHRYLSTYASRSLGLIGLIIIFCTFPILCVGGLYHTSLNNSYITFVAAFNMWLALGAGVLGSFCCSALVYRKISLFDLLFSGINGGIAFSSSSDLHKNPAVPLAVGFLTGLMTSFYHYRALRKFNKNGVKSSLSQISRFIIPGFISGVISAILHAIDQGSDGNYVRYIGWERSVVGQGAMQLLGIALSIGIGIFAGLIVGLLFKCVGRGANYHIQFNDNFIYKAEGESVKNH